MLIHWRTTAAGVASILTALTDMVTALSHGVITNNLSADVAAIVAGAGLLFAADSANVKKS